MSEKVTEPGIDPITGSPKTAAAFLRLLKKSGADQDEVLRTFLISAGGESEESNKNRLQQQELHAARKEIASQLKKIGNDQPIATAIIHNLHNAKLFRPDVVWTTGYVLRAQALCSIFPVSEYLVDLCIQFCLHNTRLPAATGYPIAKHLSCSRKVKGLREAELQKFLERLIQEIDPQSTGFAAEIQQILTAR